MLKAINYTEREQAYVDISVSCSLFCLHFCLILPAEFTVDTWITGKHALRPDRPPRVPEHTLQSANTHGYTHKLCISCPRGMLPSQMVWEKFGASIVTPSWNFQPPAPSSSLHFNFRHSVLLLLLLLIPAAQTLTLLSSPSPPLPSSLLITRSFSPLFQCPYRRPRWPLPTLPAPHRHRTPPPPLSAATTSKLVFPHSSVLRSLQQLSSCSSFSLCFKVRRLTLFPLYLPPPLCRSLSPSSSLSTVLSLRHDSLGVLM